MNSPLDSSASRLTKAILVYVDGRCRVGQDGQPECLRGTFFADSVRPGGPQQEQWWLELTEYIDQHYRTMGETMSDWTEWIQITLQFGQNPFPPEVQGGFAPDAISSESLRGGARGAC